MLFLLVKVQSAQPVTVGPRRARGSYLLALLLPNPVVQRAFVLRHPLLAVTFWPVLRGPYIVDDINPQTHLPWVLLLEQNISGRFVMVGVG